MFSTPQIARAIACAAALLSATAAIAGDPLAVAGRRGWVANGTGVLVDPVFGVPVALLDDPRAALPTERRSMVLQTVVETPAGSSFPRLHVTDALPEFWAQPSVWRHFTKGPGAASGFGRELRARDWAGRPETDRRAYPLDPGLRSVELAGPTSAPPGVGVVTITYGRGYIVLNWNGVIGRAYGLEFTPVLTRPFTSAGLVLGEVTGPQSGFLTLPGDAGFYRLVELTP